MTNAPFAMLVILKFYATYTEQNHQRNEKPAGFLRLQQLTGASPHYMPYVMRTILRYSAFAPFRKKESKRILKNRKAIL